MGKMIPGRIFIGNLDPSVNEAKLTSLFSKFGKVKDVEIMKSHETNESRGFGFLTFDTASAAEDAMKNQTGKNLNGRPIRIAPALKHKDDELERGPNRNFKNRGRSPGRRGRRDYSRSPVRRRSSRYSPDYDDEFRDNPNMAGGLNGINEFLINAASTLMNNNGNMMGPSNPAALNMMMMLNKQNQGYNNNNAQNMNNQLASLQSMLMSNNINPSTLTPSNLLALVNNMGGNSSFGSNTGMNSSMMNNGGGNNMNNLLTGLVSQLNSGSNALGNNAPMAASNKFMMMQQQTGPKMGMMNNGALGGGNMLDQGNSFLGSVTSTMPNNGNSSGFNNRMYNNMNNDGNQTLGTMNPQIHSGNSLASGNNMMSESVGMSYRNNSGMGAALPFNNLNNSSNMLVGPNKMPPNLPPVSLSNPGLMNLGNNSLNPYNMLRDNLVANNQFSSFGGGMLGPVPDSFNSSIVDKEHSSTLGNGGDMRRFDGEYEYDTNFEYRKRGGGNSSDYRFDDYSERRRSPDRPLHRRR